VGEWQLPYDESYDVLSGDLGKAHVMEGSGRAFMVSWDYVCKSVTWVVEYGLLHQDPSGVTAIGVDEIAHQKGPKFLTLVYQVDAGCRRLLWIGEGQPQKTLESFFAWFGKERSAALQFVCSDMWKGFVKVIRLHAQQALHILDKFHIVANLHKAVDEIRRREAAELRRRGSTSP
jgi:transposase